LGIGWVGDFSGLARWAISKRAVEITDTAVKSTPQDHPDRASQLNNLGHWLRTRFQQTSSMDDLNRAVDDADMAVNSTAQDHPDRAGRLSNLKNQFGRRFERTGHRLENGI
jgi:hypothetical protein